MNQQNEYVVEVKHHPDARRTYCFTVPAALAFIIVPGTLLWVDTRKGKTLAIAVCHAACDPDRIKEMMERTGTKKVLRSVLAVHTWANPRSIDIPAVFLMSPPRMEKVIRRETEYRETGRFHTRIEITHLWHTLTDGYSAYVAAKRLSLSAIPVWVIEEGEAGKEAYCRAID